MSDGYPNLSVSASIDMTAVQWVTGYDEADANVVFVCSDKKAFGIHDYFLKAERLVSPLSCNLQTQAGLITLQCFFPRDVSRRYPKRSYRP